MEIEKFKDTVLNWFKEWFDKNYRSGVPRIPPHTHNGIDNLPIPSTSITGNFDASRINNLPSAGGKPGGVNGDIQINASSAFGTVGGMNVDQTGNTRGTNALDIQTKRGAVTQVASGKYSTAIGAGTNTASGYLTTAAGYGNTNSGSYSAAFGYGNIISAEGAQAFGSGNTASGKYSLAAGDYNVAAGFDDIAIGFRNTTSNYGSSISIGISNTVSNGGWAFGVNTTASTKGELIIKTIDTSDFHLGPNFNLGIHGVSYGGGQGVVFLHNAGTSPSTNPSAGGVLYSTAGSLHWLGSSGTDTAIAPA